MLQILNRLRRQEVIHLPGLYSPMTWINTFVGVTQLFLAQDATDRDRAVALLSVALTLLLTKNRIAIGASTLGGAMQILSSGVLGNIGIFMQGSAAGYAVIENADIGNQLEKEQDERRRLFPGAAHRLGN